MALWCAKGRTSPSVPVWQAYRTFYLRKKLTKTVKVEPYKSVHPYIYENGTLYHGKKLDEMKDFQPVVVHNVNFERRYTEYLKDKQAGKFPELEAKPIPFGEWNPATSVRAGLIAIKVKMYRFWDEHGNRVPVTMLWAPNCTVVDHCWPEKHGRWSNIVAAGYPNDDDPISYKEAMTFRKVSSVVDNFRFRHVKKEFIVTEDGMLPLGFRISVRHFLPGQHIDVTAKTKGKGFEGVMRRWGFKGGPASHGSSLFHRRPGSIGTVGDAMVRPGKKMPGHMGHERRTVQSYVFMIDYKNDLIYVQGSIPGEKGQYVVIQDSYWKDFEDGQQPPFPSFLPDPAEDLSEMSFEECQLKAKAKYKYHLDFGHPTGGPPMPAE